jgi:hypothetical protein
MTLEESWSSMIVEPLAVNNASSVTQNFKRTGQTGAQSDWVNTTTNSVTDRGTMRISHQKFGKGGVSRRTLIQLTRSVTSAVTGEKELVTMNLTLSQPEVRSVITDAQLDDIKVELYGIIGNATYWGNLKLGES